MASPPFDPAAMARQFQSSLARSQQMREMRRLDAARQLEARKREAQQQRARDLETVMRFGQLGQPPPVAGLHADARALGEAVRRSQQEGQAAAQQAAVRDLLPGMVAASQGLPIELPGAPDVDFLNRLRASPSGTFRDLGPSIPLDPASTRVLAQRPLQEQFGLERELDVARRAPPGGAWITLASRNSPDSITRQANDPELRRFAQSHGPNTYRVGSSTGSAKDLFAPLGQADVAVAEGAGRIASLGWLAQDLTRIGPGATGWRGWVTGNIAPWLSQVSDQGGDFFANLVSDASEEEVTAFRTRAKAVVGQAISTFLQEEGRISDFERQLVEDAMRLTQPGSSPKSSMAALQALLSMEVLSRDRAQFQTGKPVRRNWNDEAVILKELRKLRALGMDQSTAMRTMRELQTQQDLLHENRLPLFPTADLLEQITRRSPLLNPNP